MIALAVNARFDLCGRLAEPASSMCSSRPPRAIVELILDELSASDVAQFRLTCVANGVAAV